MNTVAIVTLYHSNHNFGGQLQAYALQKTVSGYGFDCKIIDYRVKNRFAKIKVLSPKTVIDRFLLKTQMKIHLLLNREQNKQFQKKYKLFEAFIKEIPHTKEFTGQETDILKAFDYWIVGSDQVWNPEAFVSGPLYLLKDVSGIKFSYAASSMNAKYSRAQEIELKNALKDYKAISVREEGLKNAIQKITGKDVRVVLDPTLLLSSKEWDEISIPPKINDKFIFAYIIIKDDEIRKKIYEFSKEQGLRLVIVPHAQGWYKSGDDRYYDIQAADIGPKEWLGYIKHAEYVFTDSFHGTVFSVIYHKKFISFETLNGQEDHDNGLRKYSLLNKLGILERCVPYSEDQIKEKISREIDYNHVDSLLNKLKEGSLNYIEDALEVKNDRKNN